ncbi:MAG TPA: NapC/NirT family cytochrome c [Burkholderiales bacterium]|nr:NapC/NirT family cytochrome c [Burkholderiales bacterium]
MADMPTSGSLWSRLFSPSAKYSVFALLAAGIVVGLAGLAGFGYALHATSTIEFCSTCHANDAAKEWLQSAHHNNRVGVIAGCSDCHLPREFVPKMVRKVKAAREVWNHFTGKINTPEKYEAHRLEMAENEWVRMRANGAQECRNCHHPALIVDKDKAYVPDMHKTALASGQICIDCHKGVAHRAPEQAAAAPAK